MALFNGQTFAAFSSFDYDEDNFTAVWTLQNPIEAEHMAIYLSDSIVDLDGVALDGEWVDTRANLVNGSGDGQPGEGSSCSASTSCRATWSTLVVKCP